MKSDNDIVIQAKRKLNDNWSDLLHYWDDDFKRKYEKEVIFEMNNCLDNILSCFNATLEQENDLEIKLQNIDERISQ